MESKETEFKGGYLNGFLMCIIDVLLFVSTIWALCMCIRQESLAYGLLCLYLLGIPMAAYLMHQGAKVLAFYMLVYLAGLLRVLVADAHLLCPFPTAAVPH